MEREKNILGGTNASLLILFEEFQNRSGFETEPGEECLISSQQGALFKHLGTFTYIY